MLSEEQDDLFKGYGVEITLKSEQDFLKVKETLQRIGVASKHDKKLYQSCHILHKRGRYAIVHFKEMFAFDGKDTTLTNEDIERRNAIVLLLHEWELLTIKWSNMLGKTAPLSSIKVISFSEKNEWQLIQKYSVGTRGR